MEIILFLAIIFLLTYIIGKGLSKIKIPWIFAPLLIGLVLSVKNPFQEITQSNTFLFLAQLGMYLILFSIGFQLNLKEIKESSKFIFKITTAIILSETLVASILIHFIFGLPWLISILLSLSFATIGEAILLPILDEFKLTKTRFGQTILSIGVMDDVFEVLAIILITLLIRYTTKISPLGSIVDILILIALFAITFLIIKYSEKIKIFQDKNNLIIFLLLMLTFFLFLEIGSIINAAAIGSLLAGIALKKLIPEKSIEKIESQIKAITYGFLAPIFFLWVGLDVNLNYIIKYPALIIIFTLATYLTKAITSFFIARPSLGNKKAFLLGISLCVRLSTSIVVLKLLLEEALISSEIYSVLIGTQLVFKFIIPLALSYFITKWKISK